VARGLHAIAIPTQIITADSDFIVVDGALKLVNGAIADRVVRFVDELLLLTERAASEPREIWDVARLRHASANAGSSIPWHLP
jgi:hypothetical protein